MSFRSWIGRLFGGGEVEPPPPLPQAERRDYTASELAHYDGSDPQRALLFAVSGDVYDVGRGRAFYGPGGPYSMFAGKDCTRALAKMSFEPEDFTGDTDGLTQDERDKLQDWIETLSGKYDKVGKLIVD